jgi:hypothetical protein
MQAACADFQSICFKDCELMGSFCQWKRQCGTHAPATRASARPAAGRCACWVHPDVWKPFKRPAVRVRCVALCVYMYMPARERCRPGRRARPLQPRSMEWSAGWEHLPAELLLFTVRIASSGVESLAAVTTRYLLVCQSWRHALPLGACNACPPVQLEQHR